MKNETVTLAIGRVTPVTLIVELTLATSGIGVTVVLLFCGVMIGERPPSRPTSPPTLSSTNRLHTPLGLVPTNAESPVL